MRQGHGECGEHGGDPESIGLFYEAGLDYVSCSPYRVPLARLAAAQAALKDAGVEALARARAEVLKRRFIFKEVPQACPCTLLYVVSDFGDAYM